MRVVLVTFRDGQRKEFPLNGARVVLGRQEECTLRIPTSDVSRKHCAIEMQPGGLGVRDLGSTNGTFVNGERISEQTLKAGDKLGVGPVIFVVQIDGKPASITEKDVTPPAPAAAGAAPARASARPTEDVEFDAADLELDDLMLSIDDDEPTKERPRPAAAPDPKKKKG